MNLGPAVQAEKAEKPQSPIEGVTEEIRQHQQQAHNLIDILLQRLDPVLRQAVPTIGTGNPPPAASYPPASPLHGELVDRLDHAKGLNVRLQDLIDRLVVG